MPFFNPRKNTDRLGEEILGDIRENLGTERYSTSKDDIINSMGNDELFKRFLERLGIMVDGDIKRAIREIYEVELDV